MKEGDIILTPLPQADGKTKLRPALLLRKMPGYDDYLVCGISSKLHQHIEQLDEVILEADVNYKQCCLKSPSLVRLGFLAILPLKNIVGSIGMISKERHQRLLNNLASYLLKK